VKVLLIAVVGNDNFGDEAMFKSAYRLLRNGDHDVTVATYKVSRAKERFPEIHFVSLPSLSRIDIYKCLLGMPMRFLDESQYEALYVAGSGGLNSMYFGHVCLLWSIVKFFKKSKKYVEFRPQSVGPFFGKYKWWAERMVVDIVNNADKFYVREMVSYRYLTKKKLNVELVRDDAWNIDTFELELPIQNYVAISIRPWVEDGVLRDYFLKLEKLIIREGYNVLYVPIAFSGANRYIDNSFLKGVAKGAFLEDFVDISNATPEMIKGVIANSKFTIGMSYHFNVFALSLGKPSAAVYADEYYRIKNVGLYEAWGSKDAVFKIPETPPEVIISHLKKLTLNNHNFDSVNDM
jgi:polysaccharide pyruvyl transferase WcaK-like protein